MTPSAPPGFGAELAVVAAGGALGSAVRYGALRAAPVASHTFPTTTLVVNVAGAFALGVLLAAIAKASGSRWWVRPLLATGALGALTTVSSFAVETVELARAHRPLVATAYVASTVVAGLVAAAAGLLGGGWRPVRPVPDEGES